jgi:hypothetical protein
MRWILIFCMVGVGAVACARERFAGFSRPAEEFSSLASRGDSAGMTRMAAGPEPVRRMLEIARTDSLLVASAARGLRASYGSIQGDTAAVEFRPAEHESRRFGFMFLRHGGGWRILAVQVVHSVDVGVSPDSSAPVRE